ncbi:unnamed protein product [Tilletia controversa]|uniref:Uncharacterized protein n=3 Tax=Tilletia TaxID=13289 RepID=A0A8X7MR25_9BASI|nr:hypothetical protein CF336_g3750 [Tilletia laevis]KAE8197743.1 hypothetical protein CF328_g3757 [Tilletia controversa]KAE8256871.1 hypothetical protein A4X03_0g4973 [Tilletia caries]KAE8203582.1 hypothetical protein CF335_g2961 [Tilletia laevis]KAE8245553.1 hypothetical protein A4X06_0g5604 [Tilletia controversa]
MASASVYYKFRSQKDFSRITFDGTGISVWDLKREIILQNKMGRGQDFDLKLLNADTGQEYTDDHAIIPRSSQVTAQRGPPSRPNEGTAQKYVAAHFAGLASAAGLGTNDNGPGSRFSHNANASGVAPSGSTNGPSSSSANDSKRGMGAMSRRFDGRTAPPPAPAPAVPDASSIEAPTGDEASSIAAMFAAGNAEWDQAQQGMSTATWVGRGGVTRRGGRGFHGGGRGGGRGGGEGGGFSERRPQHPGGPGGAAAHKPPGPGYICYRCGQKGHWIQDCPTNDDRDFDNRPRLKRTTGIPKSMLKTIEQPPEGALLSGGVMITPDGSYVIAQADTAAWQKNQELAKPLSENDVYAQVPSDSSLACLLCAKLLRNAVKTPCCGTLYCEECIQTHLLEHDFQCAECERRIPDLADLKRDEETIKKVRKYVEDAMVRHERGEEGAAPVLALENGKQDQEQPAAGGTKGGDETTSDPSAAGMKREGSATEQRGTNTPTTPSTGTNATTLMPSKHRLPAKPIGDGSNNNSADAGGRNDVNNGHSHTSGNGNGNNNNNGFMNPAMMLPQMMMMLQNPNLPPQMRMQLQMNVQMIQAQLMNGGGGGGGGGQGQNWNPMMGMNMGGMGMGGMGMNMGMGMGMQQQQQQHNLAARSGNPYNYQAPQHTSSSPYERVHVPNWANSQQDQTQRRPQQQQQQQQPQQQQQHSTSLSISGVASGSVGRKRDRGQSDLVEVGGGGDFGTGGDARHDGGAGPGGAEAEVDGNEDGGPASKVARTS